MLGQFLGGIVGFGGSGGIGFDGRYNIGLWRYAMGRTVMRRITV